MKNIWYDFFKRTEKELYLCFGENLLISSKKEGEVLVKRTRMAEKIFIKVDNCMCEVWINRILISKGVEWLIERHDNIKICYEGKCIYQECEENEVVKLPFANPCVKTYPYFTALVGILEAYKREQVWIFNNYILFWMFRFIHFNEYWFDFKYGNEDIQDEFCMQINKQIVYRRNVSNILDFLEKAILEKNYIFLSLDMYYLDNYWNGNRRRHLKHQVLINGFNREDMYFLVTDFMANKKYRTIKVEYSILEIAYESWNKDKEKTLVNFGDDIWLLGLNEKVCESIDMFRIYNLCLDALNSQDNHYKSYLWWERKKEDLAYGKDFFRELSSALQEYMQLETNKFDIRPFHLLVEFGAIMNRRVRYLIETSYLITNYNTNLLLQIIEEYMIQSTIMQNLSILYKVKKDSNILIKIQNMLKNLEKNYVSILEYLMLCIEENVEIENEVF